MKKILKNNRGFSLAEAIIALAIILIVSATSLTVIISSISAKGNTNKRFAAQNFAENVLECFKSCSEWEDFDRYSHMIAIETDANGEPNGDQIENGAEPEIYVTNFERSLEFALDVNSQSDLNVTVYPSVIIYTYASQEHNFEAKIEITNDESKDLRTIKINVKTKDSGEGRKPIISLEYTK